MNTATTNTCVSVCAYSLYAQTDKQVYSLRQNMLTSNFKKPVLRYLYFASTKTYNQWDCLMRVLRVMARSHDFK